jgi:membrane-associated protease RseP (regulator of RpoE activity)
MRLTPRSLLIHGTLLLLTFLTTTLAGVQWLNKDFLELTNFSLGIPYSLLLLFMLGSHEFGHYVAARLHRVDATLPFFLPFPAFYGLLVPFGTLGAVIRVRSAIPSRKATFDIGAAGPIAGFVASCIILAVGFRTLPGIDYLYSIHPEYAQMASIPESGLTFGRSMIFVAFERLFAPAGAFVPPMNEIYHYPFLCVGWFGMFVTMLNLIPIGQLDGGHITFSMFGTLHHRIGQVAMILLIVLGTLGFLPLFGVNFPFGWTGWLFWALLLAVFLRRTLYARPPLDDMSPLDPVRMMVGWFCVFIFVVTFSVTPFTI